MKEIQETKASFRSKYIKTVKDCFKKREYDLEHIASLDADECHKALQNFKGVGAKVTDYTLFSMERLLPFS